jgi:hypothetical protein
MNGRSHLSTPPSVLPLVRGGNFSPFFKGENTRGGLGLHPLHETEYLSIKVERIPKGDVPYVDYTQEIYP